MRTLQKSDEKGVKEPHNPPRTGLEGQWDTIDRNGQRLQFMRTRQAAGVGGGIQNFFLEHVHVEVTMLSLGKPQSIIPSATTTHSLSVGLCSHQNLYLSRIFNGMLEKENTNLGGVVLKR